MSAASAGALLGAALGIGLALVVAALGRRHPTLDQRLAPYLRTGTVRSGLLHTPARTPWAAPARLLAPFLADAQRMVTRLSSPNAQVRARLVRAGRHEDVEAFRLSQVVAGAAGLAVGLVVALTLLLVRHAPLPALLAVVVIAALSGVLLPDWALTRRVRRREARILAELPAVAELIALAVTAGEGAAGALERVASRAYGDLGDELRRTLADTRAGLPLTAAMDALGARTGVSALAKLADAISVATTRGTPLAELMRAQAQDVRQAGHRELLEAGGRKEIQMMIPVVFLILPVTLVFAIYPSLLSLRVGL